MSRDIIQELSRRSIFLTKSEETMLSWKNSVIAVRTCRGNHYFQYTYNLQCIDKNIDLLEFSTPVPKETPAADVFSDSIFASQWKNSDFTEMLITPTLWPHDPVMVDELTNISVLEWSPRGFVHSHECALATLNNIGNINIYIFVQNRWINMFSLAPQLRQFLPEDYKASDLEELKVAVNTVAVSGICWAPNLNADHSCFFVTAQKNGAIIFWSMQCYGTAMIARVCGKINENMEEISTMHWIPLSEGKFLLICSDFFGRILAYECVVRQDEIKSENVYVLWSFKDRMIVKFFYYVNIGSNIVLLFNKHRHLVIQMLDEKCKIISQYMKNINDNRITSINNTIDGFYVSTVNCKIFKVNINIMDNNLDVSINQLEFKAPCETYELYSMGFSQNNVIMALGMVNRQAMFRKEPVLHDIIFASSEKNIESAITKLLNNPTKKLTEHWDCIELIRYKAMKMNCMPSIDFDALYFEANTSVYKMKIYLILTKLYATLKKVIKINNQDLLPETSIEIIKENILLNQASSVQNDLYKIYESKSKLTNFELECYQATRYYLEFHCGKYEKSLEDYLKPDILNYVDSKLVYTCQCCDEELEGFSCKNGHLNMICSLTFTPIETDDYLVCKGCNAIARIELFDMNPMCVFCDLYLQRSYVNI